MNFKKIYKAADSKEAHFISGLLKTYSIESKLLGQDLSIGIGELPLEVIQVSIFVHNENINKAKKIIENYEKNLLSDDNIKNWKCKFCKNSNPGSFEICWNCNKDQ